MILVSYVQDEINKSYQLDTTMKINEIEPRRLDEALPPWVTKGIQPVVKYAEPYFNKAVQAASSLSKPRIVMQPGETMDQAIARTQAAGPWRPELGGVKAADPLVSNAELQALGAMPPERSGLSSFFKRRGDTGFDPDLNKTQALPGYLQNLPPARIDIKAPPKPKSDTSVVDREVRKTHDMNPRMPNKGKPSAEADAFAAEKAARAEKQAAEELAAAKKAAAAEKAGNEPPVTANTTAGTAPTAPAPAATGGRLVRPRRPGQGSSRGAAPQPEADTVTLPRDVADRLLSMAERNPAAAQAAAEKAGIPWYIPSKGGLAAGTAAGLALGGLPPAINAVSPGTIPDWANPSAYATKGAEVLAPQPLSPNERPPIVYEPDPEASSGATSAAKNASKVAPTNISQIPDDDPEVQEIIRQLEKNGKVDESTAALNRMVYLSRL